MLTPLLLNASETAGALVNDGNVSVSLVVYGSALAAVVAILWALLERNERVSLQRQNNEQSIAFRNVIEQHYKERLKTEEQHSLTQESNSRTMLESLERLLLGKPKA